MRDNIKNIQCGNSKNPVKKFKGQTKIELFENGEKVKEVKDNNMMTNMLSKIFNPPRMTIAGSELTKSFEDLTPISATALSGLLLYENTIDEDATLEYAPLTNRCIGHAGGTYTGTESTRGTLNVKESGAIKIEGQSDGYRYVWDFATDKANGTISCACLTSRAGGNCGYGKGKEKLGTNESDIFATGLGKNYDTALSSGQGLKINGPERWCEKSLLYLGKSGDKRDRFAVITDNYKLLVFETNLETIEINLADVFDSEGRKIIETTYKGKQGLSYFVDYYDLPFTISLGRISTFVENGKYCIVKHTSSTEFSFSYFDADTKSFSAVEDRVVSPEYEYSTSNTVCKSGDYWFALNRNKVIRYPSKGGTGEVVRTTSNTSGLAIKSFKNMVYTIGLYSNSREYMLIDSENPDCYFHKIDSGASYIDTNNIDNMQLISEGIILFFDLYNYSPVHFVIRALRLSPYLATINNLQTPITKTSAQTMKITYEVRPVTEEEVAE